MNEEIARAILDEDSDDKTIYEESQKYAPITTPKIIGQRRWSTYYEQVFKNYENGTFWSIGWGRGSTEYQDNGIEDISFWQVEPKEIIKIVYVPLNKVK